MIRDLLESNHFKMLYEAIRNKVRIKIKFIKGLFYFDTFKKSI